MATILAGWELGMGFWHVSALRDVARALRERGHQVVFALSDVVGPWPMLDGEGFEVLQAPVCPPQAVEVEALTRGADTHADILASTGFGSTALLEPLVTAWQALLDRVKPDLIVCDHSPFLRLAAFGQGAVVELGLGFTMPPTHLEEFPAIKGGEAQTLQEQRVLEVVREVQARRRRPCPATLPELFAGAGEFVCSFPEFDPYCRFPPRPYAGTLGGWTEPLPSPDVHRFFAYLSADLEGIDGIIEGLVRSGVPGGFYLRGASEGMRAGLRRRGVEVADRPVAISEVLPKTSVVVHHGGVGTSQQAASAGRPQLLFPRHLEQLWNATALEFLAVGRMLRGSPEPMTVAKALRQLVNIPRHVEAAAEWSEQIARRGHGDPVATIVRRCEEVLESAES